MTEIFNILTDELPKMCGWCTVPKATVLASMVLALRPEICVEVGVYGGRSLLPLALAHKSIGRGCVWGIDPWSNLIAVREQTTEADRAWWKNEDLEARFNEVNTMIVKHAVQPFVKIIRQESKVVVSPKGIGIFHCDGSHSDTAIGDVIKFAPNVILGGFAVLDDITWAGGGVTKAEKRLLQLGFIKLYALETGAAYQRVK